MAGGRRYAILDRVKPWSHRNGNHVLVRHVVQVSVFLGVVLLLGAYLLTVSAPLTDYMSRFSLSKVKHMDSKLDSVLRKASMDDRTVILTTLNEAWSEPGSVFDLFLESFRIGDQTEKLLNHLVVITMDQQAYARCLALNLNCYELQTNGKDFSREAIFMTPDYLHMMWRRIEVLGTILEMGYSFVFTDVDVMWLRNPFEHFHKNGDVQISCDYFNGNATDKNNYPNGGFKYIRSSTRTIQFYKFWYTSRTKYPGLKNQDVFNKIKKHPFLLKIRLDLRFLDSAYFGGFCKFNTKGIRQICTMHANCCVGLDLKTHYLRILLDGWKSFMSLSPFERSNSNFRWTPPTGCWTSFGNHNVTTNSTQNVLSL